MLTGVNSRLGLLLALIMWGLTQPAFATIQVEVQPLSSSRDVDFGRLKSIQDDGSLATGTEVRQVRIIVQNTTPNQRFAVWQIVMRDFTNEKGQPLPLSSIRYSVQIENGQGLVRIPNRHTLSSGDEQIFISNPEGGNVQLLLTYEMSIQPRQKSGRYISSVEYRTETL